jgi:hypothetical protein
MASTATTKLPTKADTLYEYATQRDALEIDAQLRGKPREAILRLEAPARLRWFYLIQLRHRELNRITKDLLELLEPNNDVRIISLIGMTGIGKTTLGEQMLAALLAKYRGKARPGEILVLYVRAPANGERSLSWSTLYTRILEAGNEPLIRGKQPVPVTQDGRYFVPRKRDTLASLRESLERMLVYRNVVVVIVDEALHLLRFSDYAAVMDTLKSLADIHSTKLLLLGSFDIADLMTQYGQVARRSEILHYKRYLMPKGMWNAKDPDCEEYFGIIKRFQGLWPCTDIPNLSAVPDLLMQACLGSVGMTKSFSLRLASLQMSARDEKWSQAFMAKAAKSTKLLQKIEDETVRGEELLRGATYGESLFALDENAKTLAARMGTGSVA